jgi:diacylglycerol kinase (ATP)
MRITLIHNPSAGEGNSSADELMEWLAGAGFDTRYQSTSEDGWESALKKPAEFVIAAGGDGTVTKVATALPPDALLAILPLGTANNLATSFGILGAPRRLIASLSKFKPRPFDLWRAAGPWGEEIMIEGSGLGVITETGNALHLADDVPIDPLDKLTLARMVMKNLVTRLRPFELRAEADGKVIEGSFLAFEVMNIGLAGPQLSLCGKARSDDGKLDVAVVRTEERDEFAKWLARGARKSWRKTPLHRCRSLELTWHGERLRLTDGIAWPAEGEEPDPSLEKKSGKKSGKEKKKKKAKKGGKKTPLPETDARVTKRSFRWQSMRSGCWRRSRTSLRHMLSR